MKWKLAACKYAPEVKGKQDPLRSTCLFSEHCHRHPANTLASALSLEGTLLPRGGSQTGAPGHIHQALLNYCVKKGECECSQRATKHSHCDFPLSFVLLSLPVRLLSWHTNCRREPKHFKKRNLEEAWDLSEPFWIRFWASDTSDSVIQGMLTATAWESKQDAQSKQIAPLQLSDENYVITFILKKEWNSEMWSCEWVVTCH